MMSPEIIDVIFKISHARDFDTAWCELKKGAGFLELIVPYYFFLYLSDSSNTIKELEDNNCFVIKDDYPDAFNAFYIDGGFNDYDLACDWALKQNRSALWSEVFRPVEEKTNLDKHKELYLMAQDMGMKTGAIIPLKSASNLGLGGVTILTDSGLSEVQGNMLLAERMATMEKLAHAFHNFRPLKTQSLKQFKLTAKEREVLRRVCMGQRTQQIAFEQKKFVGVVEKQIANVKRKLNARTLPQAVAKAVHFDLIDF